MATTKAKVERALYGPSITEVTLGAVLSVALGAVLAAAFLILKPVEKATAVPADAAPGIVYYVEGSKNAAKGRQYLRKRQLFLEGSAESISLSEDELNTWITSSRANPGAAESGGIFTPKSVNFRVQEGSLQIGMPSSLNFFTTDRTVILQTRGGFAQGGGRIRFEPRELYVGSLAAHRIPGLAPLVVARVLGAQDIPPDVYQAWTQLRSVTVEKDHLLLSF